MCHFLTLKHLKSETNTTNTQQIKYVVNTWMNISYLDQATELLRHIWNRLSGHPAISEYLEPHNVSKWYRISLLLQTPVQPKGLIIPGLKLLWLSSRQPQRTSVNIPLVIFHSSVFRFWSLKFPIVLTSLVCLYSHFWIQTSLFQ